VFVEVIRLEPGDVILGALEDGAHVIEGLWKLDLETRFAHSRVILAMAGRVR